MTSQFKFWFMGAWRPVTNMLRGEDRVAHPEQANKVVFYIDGHGFVAATANPGEIFTAGGVAVDAGGSWDSI